MRVTVRNLVKRFGAVTVLKGVSLDIEEHELFFLLGPSGCGKTTLLRLLAGFYQPDEGEIRFGDRSMVGVAPHRRHAGMVFQNYALWPHMTVAENVAYGLEVRGLSAREREQRVQEALSVVRMEGLGGRSPAELSGGQQQRVALARALVIQPDVLLLDEPLSNLDARLRLEMREEIRRIHDQTRITTLYVTHDQKESLSLADRMAVMHEGGIEQMGTPREVYRAPVNRFVADFIGETNWLPGEVVAAAAQQLRVRTAFGEWTVVADAGRLAGGRWVWVGFRPEAVVIGPAEVNCLRTRVAHVTYLGEVEQYLLEVAPDTRLKACEQNPAVIRRPGEELTVHLCPSDLFLLARKADEVPGA